MAFLDLVIPSRRRARFESLVDQVACASVEAVCRRVELRVSDMTPAEARGYIRARSASVANQKVDAVLAHRPRHLVARREEIVASAREEIIRRVMARVRQIRTQRPAYRRAA